MFQQKAMHFVESFELVMHMIGPPVIIFIKYDLIFRPLNFTHLLHGSIEMQEIARQTTNTHTSRGDRQRAIERDMDTHQKIARLA